MYDRRGKGGLWQEKQSLNSQLGLLADAIYESPAVHSMLVIQPDKNRKHLGWFIYAPKPIGVRRKP